MIETVLGVIQKELNTIAIPYEFMRWKSKTIPNRYWVGEYMETSTFTEDGYEEITLILTGTTKELWEVLMQDRVKIKNHFPNINGLRISTDNGSVVIYYENSFPVPTGDENLKRIQVNLRIKTWKGI